MSKEHFSIQGSSSLRDLPSPAKVHVIGVCGVAMAQLAVVLSEMGHDVSGSDKEFYEPMGSLLGRSRVRTLRDYSADNVTPDLDLVVIGNAISYGHPEVEAVERLGLRYTFFPKLLHEVVIRGKHSIVVTGTHGKSTTSALIASMLYKMGLDPGYFIGGIALDLPSSLAVGSGKLSVVEGDEYDSAFFAKVPKFDFYAPDTCIINAIEYDHADIYPSVESIKSVFDGMVRRLPESAHALCCADFPLVRQMASEWRRDVRCKISTFGEHESADARILARRYDGTTQVISVRLPLSGEVEIRAPMLGAYNARNALAGALTAEVVGIDVRAAIDAISGFKRVKRRQEVRYEKGPILIEDFAHHPTAVNQTLEALREVFPSKRLWAVYEPRSNTSRRRVFQKEYVSAFGRADKVVLCEVTARAIDAGSELLDVAELASEVRSSGVDSICLADPPSIARHLLAECSSEDVIVVMSNGSFGGLIDMLEKGLGKQAAAER